MACGGAREGEAWRHPWVADPRGSGTLRVRRQVRGQWLRGDEVVRRRQPGWPLPWLSCSPQGWGRNKVE